MIKKILIIPAAFYLLALLQASFFVHFKIFSFLPSFILIAVVLINIFEDPRKDSGIFAGFIGGLFWDILSSGIIGFYALILLAAAFLIKLIFREYVRVPIR